MITQKKLVFSGLHLYACFGIGMLFLLAIALRISLFHIVTSDYTAFLSQWYDFIQTHGGFAALKYNFSNYNPPYLYLLTLATYLPIPKLIAIKAISAVFDGLLGLFAYLILSLKFKRSYAAAIGVLVMLFAPTIIINSSAWGQADAIYAAFCLGSLYFLLKERPAWACIFFGLAISFKLQAIFFLPVLLVLALKRRLPIRYLALIPAVFLLMLLPAFIAGRDAWSLLTIYVGQITNSSVGVVGQFTNGRQINNGGAGTFPGGSTGQFNGGGTGTSPGGFNGGGNFGGGSTSSSLTLNAPSIYQWFPANTPQAWEWLGIALAALVVIAVGIMLLVSKRQVMTATILKVALVFAIAIPFVLPEMHERYFYLADGLSIIYAFYFPRRGFIAVLMQLCSLLSYLPYLINTQVVSLGLVAFGVLAIAIVAFADLVMELFPGIRTWMTMADSRGDEARPGQIEEPERAEV